MRRRRSSRKGENMGETGALRVHRDAHMSVNRRQSDLGSVRHSGVGGQAAAARGARSQLWYAKHGSHQAATAAIAGERVSRPSAVSTQAVDERDRRRRRRCRLRQPGPQRGHSRYVTPFLPALVSPFGEKRESVSLSRSHNRP